MTAENVDLNSCCALLEGKLQTSEEKRSALRECVKLLKKKIQLLGQDFELLQTENLDLRKEAEQQRKLAECEHQDKLNESQAKSNLENELRVLKSELSRMQQQETSAMQPRDVERGVAVNQERVAEAEMEIQRLTACLEQEILKVDVERQNARKLKGILDMRKCEKTKLLEQKRNLEEAQRIVNSERMKAEEERKRADDHSKLADDYKIQLQLAREETERVRIFWLSVKSKAEEYQKNFEAERHKALMAKRQSDSILEDLKKETEALSRKAAEEKSRAEELSRVLKEQKLQVSEFQTGSNKYSSPAVGAPSSETGQEPFKRGATGSDNIVKGPWRSDGLENVNTHQSFLKRKEEKHFNGDAKTIKLLKKHLKLERDRAAHAFEVARLETDRRSLLCRELYVVKQDFFHLTRRLHLLDEFAPRCPEGIDDTPQRELECAALLYGRGGYCRGEGLTGINSYERKTSRSSGINSTAVSLSDRRLMGPRLEGNALSITMSTPGNSQSVVPKSQSEVADEVNRNDGDEKSDFHGRKRKVDESIRHPRAKGKRVQRRKKEKIVLRKEDSDDLRLRNMQEWRAGDDGGVREMIAAGEWMKLLELDDSEDELQYQLALQRPVSPTVPDIFITPSSRGPSVSCVVFSDRSKGCEVSRIVRATADCLTSCSSPGLREVVSALVVCEADLSPSEKACALFSLLLYQVSHARGDLRARCRSFSAHVRRVMSDVEFRNAFIACCDVEEVLSLIQEFFIYRRLSLTGDAETLATEDQLVPAGVILASLCSSLDRVSFLCEISTLLNKTVPQLSMALAHVFAESCGEAYLNHGLFGGVLRSLERESDPFPPTGDAVAVTVDAVASTLLCRLQHLSSAPAINRHLREEFGTSPQPDLGACGRTLSILEMMCHGLPWDWTSARVVPQLLTLLESRPSTGMCVALVTFLGEIAGARQLPAAASCPALQLVRSVMLAVLVDPKANVVVQAASASALLLISSGGSEGPRSAAEEQVAKWLAALPVHHNVLCRRFLPPPFH